MEITVERKDILDQYNSCTDLSQLYRCVWNKDDFDWLEASQKVNVLHFRSFMPYMLRYVLTSPLTSPRPILTATTVDGTIVEISHDLVMRTRRDGEN